MNNHRGSNLYSKIEKGQMRVLHIIDSLNAGGAESLLKNFVLEAKKNDLFNIEIATLYSNAIFKDEIKNVGIPVWDLNLKYKYDFRGILKIITLIKKGKYDVIHVHLFPADIFVALSSLFLSKNINYVFTEHNTYNRRRSRKVFKILDKFTYSRYSKIICISNQTRCSLINWIPIVKKKTVVIPNGISIPDFVDFKFSEIYYDVLFVGGLSRQKGVNFLLEAISILKEKYNRYLKVAIVGDGPLKDELRKLCVKLKINNQVEFLGIQKNVNNFMRSSKVFVLPSRWEGFGLVIIEAMSNMLPVIASNVGGIPEIIENGKDGILLPPEDSETLAQAINDLLENKELREKLSQAAYKKVKKEFSIKKYSVQILDLYRSLINK